MRALLAGGLGLTVACGGPGPEDWPFERPLIEEVIFLQNSPFASDALAFALRWRDGDGNLGGGETRLFVQARRVSSRSNQVLFAEQQPPLSPEVDAGWLEFVVRLDERPSPGQRLAFSFELVDSAGEVSNRPTVTLRVLGGGG